jgi:predicted membrane protein
MDNINHNDNNQIKNSGKALGGLVIVIIGLAFLLNNLGLDIPNWIFSFWSLLIVLGIFIGVRRNFKGIGWLILVLIGSYNTIDRMGFDFDLSKYALGVGLVILGGFLIIRSNGGTGIKMKKKMRDRFKDQQATTADGIEFKAADKGAFDNDIIDVVAVFGGNTQTVYSKNFKGGDISAVFGGADIIMTQADFTETASLDVTAIFGGIKLIVPHHWAIKSNVTAIFGSVEDKRSHLTPGEIQKTLILEGTAMFGGIEIKSF